MEDVIPYPVYWRLYWSEDRESIDVICVQAFDLVEYDPDRFVNTVDYSTEGAAERARAKLTGHGAPIPLHSLDIIGLTDEPGDQADVHPTSAVQFSWVSEAERRIVFGDQRWVAHGGPQQEMPAPGRTQRRSITITYGEWEDFDV